MTEYIVAQTTEGIVRLWLSWSALKDRHRHDCNVRLRCVLLPMRDGFTPPGRLPTSERYNTGAEEVCACVRASRVTSRPSNDWDYTRPVNRRLHFADWRPASRWVMDTRLRLQTIDRFPQSSHFEILLESATSVQCNAKYKCFVTTVFKNLLYKCI